MSTRDVPTVSDPSGSQLQTILTPVMSVNSSYSLPITTNTTVPLTTIFTPPARLNCLDEAYCENVSSSHCNATWGPKRTECFPSPGPFTSLLDVTYSPGVCPLDYTMAATRESSVLNGTATYGICCPSNFNIPNTEALLMYARSSLDFYQCAVSLSPTWTFELGTTGLNDFIGTANFTGAGSTIRAQGLLVGWQCTDTAILPYLPQKLVQDCPGYTPLSTASPSDTPFPVPEPNPARAPSRSLSAGAIAGIVVGSVAAVAFFVGMLFWIRGRYLARLEMADSPTGYEDNTQEKSTHEMKAGEHAHEISGQHIARPPTELEGSPVGSYSWKERRISQSMQQC